MSDKEEGDLERASRLLTLMAMGVALSTEDLLWLRMWQGLMEDTDSVDYGPTVLWKAGEGGPARPGKKGGRKGKGSTG